MFFFSAVYADFCLCPKSVIITTLQEEKENSFAVSDYFMHAICTGEFFSGRVSTKFATVLHFYRRNARRRWWGWSGGAMVLGKLPVLGRPTIWITVGQGPTALVVGAAGGCLDIFTLICPFLSSFSLSLGDGPI